MGSGGEAVCADPVHTRLCTSQGTHPMHMSVRAPGHAHTVHCPRSPGKGGRYLASMGFHWSGRMRKMSPYQSPKMREAQQEPLYSQGHQEGEVGRGRRNHGRQEGRAGAENEKESLRIQSRVSRVQLQDELFVLSKTWLLEPRGQQSPESNRVCSSSASRSCRGRMYLYVHVHVCKHMSTCVCMCMCVLSLHLETEADVYC